MELQSDKEVLLNRVDELLQRFKPAVASSESPSIKRRASSESHRREQQASVAPTATPSSSFSRGRKGIQSPSQESALRRPAEREPIQQQQHTPHARRSQHETPRAHHRVPAAKVDPIPPTPKSAPTPGKSTSSRRESLIPRFTRQPSQPPPPAPAHSVSSRQTPRKSDENNSMTANTRSPAPKSTREKANGERSWISATLRSVTRRSQQPTAPSSSSSTPAAAASSAAPSGIPSSASSRRHSTAMSHQQHSSGKRRPTSTRF